MSNLPPPPPPPPPGGRGPGGQPTPPERPRQPGRPARPTGLPRWTVWILIGVVAALLFGSQLLTTDDGKSISYNEFMTNAKNGQVQEAKYNNDSGTISGVLKDGTKFTTTAARR
jgi:cell division protease FtsH